MEIIYTVDNRKLFGMMTRKYVIEGKTIRFSSDFNEKIES